MLIEVSIKIHHVHFPYNASLLRLIDYAHPFTRSGKRVFVNTINSHSHRIKITSHLQSHTQSTLYIAVHNAS